MTKHAKEVSLETVGAEGWRSAFDRVSGGSLGDPRVRVAVVDGSVDLSHPCFAGEALEELEAPASPALSAHGTAVASVLFGQPGSPVRGIVPRCQGLIVPVLREHDGALSASQLDLARGITLALTKGAAIINLSAGQLDPTGEPHPYLAEAVRRCHDEGALLVAAVGNDGCSCLHVPAASPSVLAVGAMDERGEPLAVSNWGAAYRAHAVLAPGTGIVGAVAGGGVALHHGTSLSAAIVTGFAALLLSAQIERGEAPDVAAVRDAILETALGCGELPSPNCDRLLAGRLNPAAAWRRLERRQVMIEGLHLAGELAAEPPRVTPSCAGGGGGGADCACRDKEKSKDPGEGGCGCGKKAAPTLVYTLGQLSFDFGSEARRDSLVQHGLSNPYDPEQLLLHLEAHPALAASVIWTLVQDATPVYAIHPFGPFAAETYALLRQFLRQQGEEGVERISVPGWIGGKATLASGQVVPMIIPEQRGMYSWATAELAQAVLGEEDGSKEAHERREGLLRFLNRVYYEQRNLGILPQERAINFAATNAFQLGEIYSRAARDGMQLDEITAERSPICRPESDCWDVKLTFFHPRRRMEQAREVYRLTVDVSDVVPVTVGPVRSWHIY